MQYVIGRPVINEVLQTVCDAVKRASEPVSTLWDVMIADQPDTIVDLYKGMEICVQARRFGMHAWRCSIKIGNARHLALHSVTATLHATEEGVTKQAALLGAFIEAMALCDLLVEKPRPR